MKTKILLLGHLPLVECPDLPRHTMLLVGRKDCRGEEWMSMRALAVQIGTEDKIRVMLPTEFSVKPQTYAMSEGKLVGDRIEFSLRIKYEIRSRSIEAISSPKPSVPPDTAI